MTDYSTAGLSLKQHPVSLVRDQLDEMKIITAEQLQQLPHGRWVSVAGLVLIRQRPGTASGIVFETLEDETGIVNLIIRPNIYDKYPPAPPATPACSTPRATSSSRARSSTSWSGACTTSAISSQGCQFTSRDFH